MVNYHPLLVDSLKNKGLHIHILYSLGTPYTMKLVELGTDLKLTVQTSGWDTKPTVTWSAGSSNYETGKS